jgi:predicted phage baseplate assembly protein
VVAGPLTDPRGTSGAEAATIEAVAHLLRPEGGTVIELKEPLGQSYVRAGLAINANVARATHGDTRAEILGSGDATQLYQRFTLRQTPLTYVGASAPSGVESTLRVYVDDVLWQEVPSLYGHGPDEHVYVTRHHDDGATTIQFGGRLPTGQDNVRAIYRRGIGLEGLVKRDQLSLLMSRPLGLGGVTNPLPATGADDPETLEAARRNAPLTVLTLDRIVSLRDYEDFARAFAGVSKALATWVQVGEDRGVLVTVAGPNGAAIQDVGPDSVYRHLLDAMRGAGDPSVPIRLVSYRPRTFHLGAVVKVDRTRLIEKVVPAVAAALGDAFSFSARSLGQAVTLSEVIGIIQSVDGVVAVAVDALHRTDESPGPAPAQVLLAARPTPGAGASAQPAELLTLETAPPDLRGTQGELP